MLTPLGPRVALIKSDYINVGKVIEIEIILIQHKEIKWKTIEELLDYGKLHGLGQFRNGGFGRFNWKYIQ